MVISIRGGVLEPQGTVEIKFRYKDLSKAMHRLDAQCLSIKERMASPELSQPDRLHLERDMRDREEELLPVYHQVAIMFADLHDKPGRMHEKGVVTVRHADIKFPTNS